MKYEDMFKGLDKHECWMSGHQWEYDGDIHEGQQGPVFTFFATCEVCGYQLTATDVEVTNDGSKE